MKRSSAFLLTAAALAAVTAVVAVKIGGWWKGNPPSAKETAAAPPGAGPRPVAACAFEPGERAAFSLQLNTQPRGAPSSGDQFKAVLSWEVVGAPRPDEWLLRAAFSSIELQQESSKPEERLTQPLDGTFMIRVGRDCRFTGKGYPPDWEPATRRFVSTVLSSFEFAVVPTSPGPTWEIDQTDGLGRYTARYNAVALSDGGFEITKVKRFYRGDDRAQAMGFQLQLLGAKEEATLDARGRWLRRAVGGEQVRLRVQKQVLAELDMRYELTRDDARFVRPDPGVLMAAVDWQDPSEMVAKAQDAPVDPDLAKLSLGAALDRFSQIYERDPYAAGLFLAGWLKAHPEGADTLLATLRDGGIADRMRPAAFFALEHCGTPQARAVLMTALADESMTEIDRARAASALSDVPQPTKESARALVEAASASDSQPQLVSGTSVRALGHLTERARTLDPEMQQELQATLRQELGAARDDSRAIDVVDAIGNSGDPYFVPALEERLADGSPAMREHAARALRRMAPSDATAPLMTRLEVETDPSVQIALVDTLTGLGVKEPSAIELANTQLAGQPAPEVRAALIRWLGAAADQPAARAALVAQFHREQVPQLQQLIGRFVSADELS